MVYTCDDLLRALSSGQAAAASPVTATYGSTTQPRVLILGANISISPCWPRDAAVHVTGVSLMIFGLPDVTTTLDLAGRPDAFELVRGSLVKGKQPRRGELDGGSVGAISIWIQCIHLKI